MGRHVKDRLETSANGAGQGHDPPALAVNGRKGMKGLGGKRTASDYLEQTFMAVS